MDKELYLLEFLIDHQKKNTSTNQRQLSKQMEVSLGKINSMIQSLENRGMLHVNKDKTRAVVYQVTDKGLEYTKQLSIDHISACFDTITNTRSLIKNNLEQLVKQGKQDFLIYGEYNDLYKLTRMCLIELSRKYDISYEHISQVSNLKDYTMADREAKSVVVGWDMMPELEVDGLNYLSIL